jgi:hypothetical protein
MKIVEKIYAPKIGKKISWHQTTPYKLGDEGRNFPFNVQIMDKQNTILEQRIVNVPSQIMDSWAEDETITNFLLSQLGLELYLDDTLDKVLAKLESGTITYASGTQEENDIILKNYASFLTLQIQSYKEGSLEIDEFIDISNYDVTVTSDSVAMTMKEFVLSLQGLSDAEKTSKLNSCVASIEAWLEDEEEVVVAQSSTTQEGDNSVGGGVLGSPRIDEA